MSRRETREDPFAVLSIAPTFDLGVVKRAYFKAIQICPPHRDPKAFERIRHAYEQLERPGGLAAACLRAPVDVDVERRSLEEKWQPLLDAAARDVASERRRRQLIATFVASVSTRGFDELVPER